MNRSFFKKYSAILAMTVLTAVLFLLKACAKEENPTGIITMTTLASEVSFTVAGTGDITIDWGDGKKSNLNDASFEASFDESFGYFKFSQSFSSTALHNIVINGNVTELYCQNIGLTVLDISRNTALTVLHCTRNQLTTLDVSRNTALTDLYCSYNQLTALDVSMNTALKDLDFGINQITTLDVNKNPALESLQCDWNHLTRLDVTKNTALTVLSILGNQFTVSALNDLFRTLPDYSKTDDVAAAIYISERNPNAGSNPATLECDRSIAEKRGWHFRTRR